MGMAAAYNIGKAGDQGVVVLDRHGVGNDLCSSNDANRVFRYSYGSDETYTRMAVKSLQLWNQLEKESGQELLIPTGLLLLQGQNKSANSFNEASYNTLSQLELGAERLAESDIKKRFPQFQAKEAFLDSHGGAILASRALKTLHSMAESRGVRFEQAQANKIILDDRPRVETEDHRSIEFGKLVVTIGAWTDTLLRSGLIPMKPTRQQLVYFKPRLGLESFRPEKCPVFFTDEHYGLPAAGIEGVKVSPKELSEVVDPETAKRTIDDKTVSECRQVCRNFVPALVDADVFHSRVCIYDMTDNSDFVIDKDPEHPSVIYGYGFSGHGFKFAPLIGQLLAELALDQEPGFDLERFSIKSSMRKPAVSGPHLGKDQ